MEGFLFLKKMFVISKISPKVLKAPFRGGKISARHFGFCSWLFSSSSQA